MSEAHGRAKLQPRVRRLRDTSYLGMDRNRFNTEIRPCLTESLIGKKRVGFDRLELDEYVTRNERPAQNVERWDENWIPGLFKLRGTWWDTDICIQGRRIGQATGLTN